MADSLEETLRLAANGDAPAWRYLIEVYSGRVYGLLYRQCGNAELAEEMAQAAFVQVVERLGDYQEQGKFEAWLFRIATNLLRDEIRRRKRQARPTDFDTLPPESWSSREGNEPVDGMLENEQAEMLRKAINELPDADREILYLRYTAELAFNQIAEVLDQPLGTVLARGHRALKKLRQKLLAIEANEP